MSAQIEIPDAFPVAGEVAGKRVVITGAGRGLGALLAHAFSSAGARVVLVARTERDLKAVAGALPGPSLVMSGDVTDEDCNEAVADAAVREWGGLDVWIANAGISPLVAGPRETDAAVWRRVLEVNLTGAFLGARAAARVMERGGRVIFTGSVLGRAAAEGVCRLTARRRPDCRRWPRGWRSIWHRPASPSTSWRPAGSTRLSPRPGSGLPTCPTPSPATRRWAAGGPGGSRRRLPVPRLGCRGVRHRRRAHRRRWVPARMTGERRSTRGWSPSPARAARWVPRCRGAWRANPARPWC